MGTDRQLLDDFTARRSESAFAELVARHGPLVLRVCRRVLHHEQDAEDAFQATFLVLAHYAGSIRKREALADWLHGVAYRTAMKAKRSAARRRNHEARLRQQTPPSVASPSWDDVQAVLDEEIQRLPAAFRSAFVLCVLEGKTVPVLFHVLFAMLFPLVLSPSLLPLGVEIALEQFAGVRGFPVCLVLSVLECLLVVLLYRLVLTWQGGVLQSRELVILGVVTTRTE